MVFVVLQKFGKEGNDAKNLAILRIFFVIRRT